MKKILILLLVFSGVFMVAGDLWNDKMYAEFNYVTFKDYDPAKNEIDFDKVDYDLLNAAIFYATNEQRVKYNLDRFGFSSGLRNAAFQFSEDMVKYDFFSHTHKIDPDKRSFSQRLDLEGITQGYRAENIADGFGIAYDGGPLRIPDNNNGENFISSKTGKVIRPHTYISFAEYILDMWMNSPGHRKNILNPRYKFLGCGAFHYQKKDFYGMHYFKATQNFGSIVNKPVKTLPLK